MGRHLCMHSQDEDSSLESLHRVCFECPLCIHEAFLVKHKEEARVCTVCETGEDYNDPDRLSDSEVEEMLLRELACTNQILSYCNQRYTHDKGVQCDLDPLEMHSPMIPLILECERGPVRTVRKIQHDFEDASPEQPTVPNPAKEQKMLEKTLASLREVSHQLLMNAYLSREAKTDFSYGNGRALNHTN